MISNGEDGFQENSVISPEKSGKKKLYRQAYSKPKLMELGKLQSVTLGGTGRDIDSPTTSRPFQTAG